MYILHQDQRTFINTLILHTQVEPESDMTGYIYLYKERLKYIAESGKYSIPEKRWLNELGTYYKKLVIKNKKIEDMKTVQQQRLDDFKARYAKKKAKRTLR